MKKPYKSPAMHVVLNGAQDKVPEALSDGEIEALLGQKAYYRASDGFAAREIGGELLLIPIGGTTQSVNGLVTFSQGGAFLMKLLSAPRTKGDLIALFAAEYEKPMDDVRADVEEFLDKALDRGLVVRA